MVEANPEQKSCTAQQTVEQQSPSTNQATPATEQAVENPATFLRIKNKLEELKVPFTLTQHAPAVTAQECADVHGVSIDSGAKSMILKDCSKKLTIPGTPFYLAVVSGSKRFNSKEFKKLTKCKSIRFANAEEVLEYSGCISGAVPPFGSLFTKPVPTFVDLSLAANESINFNCGLRTHSLQIAYSDYARVEGIKEAHNFCDLTE